MSHSIRTRTAATAKSNPAPSAPGNPTAHDAPDSVGIPSSPEVATTRFWIVPHTHWDREWYAPFEHFQIRLAETLDEVLDVMERDPSFLHFTLDGQAVVLEDYLELRPDREEVLRNRLAEGRLAAGPFYVLPDPLVGGESLVRNLIVGRQVVRRYGARPSEVWYEPDTFGHVAQLPQLVRGAGLRSVVFWRGLGDEADSLGAVFRWRAPDGSEALAIRQLGGYGNACNLGHWTHKRREVPEGIEHRRDAAVERVEEFMERYGEQVRISGLGDVLLCNGDDHIRIQPELPDIAANCAERMPGSSFTIATYDQYAQLVEGLDGQEGLQLYEGEMFGGKETPVLRGVNSSRVYLKQRNEASERALLSAETLSALAWIRNRYRPVPGYSYRYPAEEIGRAWKHLLRNHPHDSICGCSVDEVHRAMMARFDSADLIASRVLRFAAAALAGRIEPYSYLPSRDAELALFNPLPWERSRVVAISLPDSLIGEERLVARTGSSAVPLQLQGERALGIFTVPGFGALPVRLEVPTGDDIPMLENEMIGADTNSIENEFYRVSVFPNGTISVLDKRTGRDFPGLHYFQDQADRGDEYNFCPLEGEKPWDSRGERAVYRVKVAGPTVAEIEIEWPDVTLPRRLDADRRALSEERVPVPLRTAVRLAAGVDRIEFRTTVDNRAEDHRLRVLFPAPDSGSWVRAEGHFALIKRPARPASNGEGWRERPIETHLTLGGVAAGKLLVMTRGLQEYEAVPTEAEGVEIAITLLRCTGWLSRDDLTTRPGHAGPGLATPEAQCPGAHVFEYAISMRGGGSDVEVTRAAQDYRYDFTVGPPDMVCGPAIFQVSGNGFAFSALKGAEDGRGLILRIYNPGAEPAEATLEGAFKEARYCRLDEEETGESVRATLPVDPYKIVTLRIE